MIELVGAVSLFKLGKPVNDIRRMFYLCRIRLSFRRKRDKILPSMQKYPFRLLGSEGIA